MKKITSNTMDKVNLEINKLLEEAKNLIIMSTASGDKEREADYVKRSANSILVATTMLVALEGRLRRGNPEMFPIFRGEN